MDQAKALLDCLRMFLEQQGAKTRPHDEDFSVGLEVRINWQTSYLQIRPANILIMDAPDFDRWSEHPDYLRRDWQYEVANHNTNLGYWEWVQNGLDYDEK